MKGDPMLLHKLYIDNCALNDEQLADILEGTVSLHQLKTLTLKNTVIDVKSVAQLKVILER